VHIRPTAEDGASARRFALIVFAAQRDERDERASVSAPAEQGEPRPGSTEIDLEEELRTTQDLLESTNLGHDRTVAELQMVNEELQSVNEEQRAATEELETGREEIQSINEELTTINQEHQSTIEELKRTNADLQNLIESTGIGTIFLDRSMRIRRFTPAAGAVFNFVAADQGRSLSDITHRLVYDRLVDDVTSVLESLEPVEREVESEDGGVYILRINPYRSMDGDYDGVVLTFFDHTAQSKGLEELTEAKLAAEIREPGEGGVPGHAVPRVPHTAERDPGVRRPPSDVGPLSEDAGEADRARIKAGGWHLASMIDEILSFAKLDGGHVVVEPSRSTRA
jgi:two-component system, chemotaxis family, CheB/CheR fusion protein